MNLQFIVILPYRWYIPNLVKIGSVVLEEKVLTDDGRRKTDDDGRQPTGIGHLSDSGDLLCRVGRQTQTNDHSDMMILHNVVMMIYDLFHVWCYLELKRNIGLLYATCVDPEILKISGVRGK